jgi:hypothetical protein
MYVASVVYEVLFRLRFDPVVDCFDRRAHAVSKVLSAHYAS